MKRYVKAYDTSTESFSTVAVEVLDHPKDTKDAVRNWALMDIISNTLSAACYDLNMSFEIDDTNFIVEGDPNIKSSYTYYASIYNFSLTKDKQPIYTELSVQDQRKVKQYLKSKLVQPEATAECYYLLDITFYYSTHQQMPKIEVAVHKCTR